MCDKEKSCGNNEAKLEAPEKLSKLYEKDLRSIEKDLSLYSQDPWKHRSKNMSCETCMWWVHKKPSNDGPVSAYSRCNDLGRCRRHAPTMSGYPAVFRNDWCGDHKVDENKI